MILDTLKNCSAYAPLHPRFVPAFEWLGNRNLATLDDGRYDIDGDQIYALIMKVEGKGAEQSRLEGHRKYIDIQATIAGRELIGWSPIADCGGAGEGYDEEHDVEFFHAKPALWTPVMEGTFAIYFPRDLHAPCAGSETVNKVVVKIAL